MAGEGAIALLGMQQQGKQQGMQAMQAFAEKMRLQSLMQKFAQANVSSPEDFKSFVAENGVNPQEAQGLLQIMSSSRAAFKPDVPPNIYSSSPQGIYNQQTGAVVSPTAPKPTVQYGSAGNSVYNKFTGDVVHEKFTPVDYYKVNDDGSVVSRKANNALEAKKFENLGFERGSYRDKALGSPTPSSTTKPIKTWVLPEVDEDGNQRTPEQRLWHAPSDRTPPAGAKPYSEAGELEKRLLTSQELISIRSDKKSVRRELDKAISLPENISIYKPYKDRIPALRAELKDLTEREQAILSGGNDLNPPSSSSPPSPQITEEMKTKYIELRNQGMTPTAATAEVMKMGNGG